MSHSRMSVAEFKALGNRESRPKFNARRCEMDGIRFDSFAEREFYALLKADKGVLHVDVHPTLTLPGGIRYKPDFLVWRAPMDIHDGYLTIRASVHVYEVKGAITQDFRRMRKLFDATHPLAPLKVIQKRGRAWVEI